MNLSTLKITPELLRLISEVDEFKGSWNALNTQSPERLEALRHVATIESIGSSTRIEGSKLSDTDIEALLSNSVSKSFESRDEQEVAGYAEVMDTIFENFDEIPLTENYVKQMHAMLLRHSNKDDRHRGEYKTQSNHIEAFDTNGKSLGVIFEATSPFDTPREMQDLILWTRESLSDAAYHPLIVTAIFNVTFLAIHPFQDGNGRLSRVLISLLLLKAGYSYIPYSSLESIVEKNKDAYYLALQRTQKTIKSDKIDWLPWLQFFLTCLKRQKDHLQIKTDAVGDYAHLPYESMLIMQYVDRNKRITLAEAERVITTIAKPTIKKRLYHLVDSKLLVIHGKARGTWYSKP
jgi:Fic family protein